MNGYEKMEKLIEVLGEETVFSELLQALSYAELAENADYIARMNDVDLEG